ncbi:phospholipase A2 family protein [Striga asiatica]|uniref:Phospholipase A2 family protein n=1 Tax=Striga asiatica TaxID=4170 RepID=A0A5A7PTI9_STRAF|nr:phospholipase A2 family protein [Striga asiatica]
MKSRLGLGSSRSGWGWGRQGWGRGRGWGHRGYPLVCHGGNRLFHVEFLLRCPPRASFSSMAWLNLQIDLPILRYGKYCGVFYTGCPNEEPCDALDKCCMDHDNCIGKTGNQYLSQLCNGKLLECVESFRKSGAPSFEGNTCQVKDVVTVISNAMRAAVVTANFFVIKP